MQDYLVHIVFVSAVAYLGWWLWKQMRPGDKGGSCDSCGDGCDTTDKTTHPTK